MGFINDLKPKEGNSFGSLYKDVLLFQSLKKDDPRIPALRKHILSLQKSDGSYGGSVSLTAMTIPVLSNWTAVDIQYSPCTGSPAKDVTPRDFVTLHYEIEESVISKQSIVGKFLAKPNQPLLDALVAFHKEHPEIFDFESFKTPFGEAIKQINGLESDEDVNWTVWRNGKKLIAGLEAINFEDEDTFLFKYDNISVE